jgi:hypothetical protein
VAGQHRPAGGLERRPVADAEFEHLLARRHLVEEAQPLDDAIVEIDELCLVR